MKSASLTLAFVSCLVALPVFAQETPAPAPPAPPPASTPASTAPVPLLPPPATPAEAPLGPFKDQKERHSYGLGTFLGNREKQNAANNPDKTTITAAELLQGLKDGMNNVKTVDYAAGLAMAAQIKRSGVDIDAVVLAEAVRNVLEGQPAKIQPQDVQVIMQELQGQITARQQARLKAEADKNLAAANAWLAENAQKEGVKTTPSGLQYIIDQQGAGRTPGPRDVVNVNLVGTSAADGTEFDRTAEGTPGRRAMMALPKGLQEGLQLMKDGGKARFWLPPALGYGDSPRGATLKPNSVLAFTIELVSSEEPPVNQPAAALGPDGKPLPKREPITAVTPPVSVEIPQGGGPPKITIEGQPAPPQAPAPAPAPDAKPAAK